MDPEERKIEIDRKLEKEINKLKMIKENVERSHQITNGMVNILSSFEHRLARLEQTILPVYNETGNLQRRQQNIEKVLSAVDQVISYYSVAEEVDSRVRAGPADCGLDEFLKEMSKLKNAITYFEKNNPQSVELENVSSLFNIGNDALCREFKELLLKHSRSIPPITLLDLITDEEVSGDDVSVGSMGQLSEDVSSRLGVISCWLMAQGRDEILQVYSRVRGSVMLKSILHLKEHQKSSSGGSTQGVPSSASPLVRPKFQARHDTPGRRASKRLQAVFEKKANKMLLKASLTLESSTGLTLGGRRSGMHLENREDIVDEQEMDSYLITVMAVQKLMQSERNSMAGIIPQPHQNRVFQNIVQDSLDTIVQDGENIAGRAKRCISRHDFGSVLIVFPILKHLLVLRPEFDRTVEGCDYTVRSQFTSILNTLHATAAKALEEVVDSLRSDTTAGLPKDGTVHELTSNMLVLVAHLADFMDTIASVLQQESTYTTALAQLQQASPESVTPQTRNNVLLGIYIKKVLSQLNCTLINKSEGYTEPGVRAIFRLNNCHHVLKSLQRSSLLSLVELCEPDCHQTYLDMIATHKRAYQLSWNKVLSYISLLDDIPLTPGKLKDKDRNTVKERFSGFNKEMEEIAKLQRGYSVPDVELRESLKRDNKEFILPKYNAFYDKYSTVPFTKNPEKYVKYSPDQVASMIDRFFDLAA
ncbi:hypothetical protein AAG570_013409 [Ranatra chinensis]|uniref:Exocyst complex component 7 n=1 Tax=Ranatra chinensis TaxID=642074 RepID=A0ABD0YC31_9HEMI